MLMKFFPKTKEQALAEGFTWSEKKKDNVYVASTLVERILYRKN